MPTLLHKWVSLNKEVMNMKKVYVSPEFELLKLRLYGDVLNGSYEVKSSEGGGDSEDLPFDPDPLL